MTLTTEPETSGLVFESANEVIRSAPALAGRKTANEHRNVPPSVLSGVVDDIGLSANALFLLKKRFLKLNGDGQPVETPSAMFQRVARALAAVETGETAQRVWEQNFYQVMASMAFHPGSRVLANAGARQPQLANCFVLPVTDDQKSLLKTFSESSIIKGHGGGCGFNFSALRPRGAAVRDIPDLAVGPVKMMQLFDLASSMFRQQGRYECGNMAILNVDHPDVFEFITAKEKDGQLGLTNASLGISDDFMLAVESGDDWPLINPHDKTVVKTVPARDVFDTACDSACRTGDPGLIFLDRINETNPLRHRLGDIAATNTCGEIGLYPYESCNLGYLNLTKLVLPAGQRSGLSIFDDKLLKAVVAVAVRMIDNTISASWFPVEAIEDTVTANRRIGLGVTGWADVLAMTGIAYDSPEAVTLAERLAEMLYEAAFDASLALGREKGPFANVTQSIWAGSSEQPRNVSLLALPPSGNNAVIFDTSFAIEPFYALAYEERVLDGITLKHQNKRLNEAMRRRNLPVDGLFDEISDNGGSIQNLKRIPEDIRACFKTAYEIAPEWHVKTQAAFQKHVDNAVTKTVNLPHWTRPEDVSDIYKLAWRSGCKGITVYRDGSRSNQAMTTETAAEEPATDAPDTCIICSA